MNDLESKKNYTAGVLASAVTAVTWGIQAIILKIAVIDIPPSAVAWFRFVFATLVTGIFLAYFYRREFWDFLKKPPLASIWAGIFLSLNYFAFMKSIELTSPSNAQIGIQLGPFGLALYGIFFFQEKLTRIQKFGMILTPLGLGLFFKDQLREFLNHESEFITGYLWVLFAAVTWIAYSVLQKILGAKINNNFILFIVYFTSTIVLSPWSYVSLAFSWDLQHWLIILILGATTLIAYGSLAFALSRTPASIVSMVITINPLLTIWIMTQLPFVTKWGLKTEKVQVLGISGALLVVVGVILSVYRPFYRRN